MYFFPSHLFHPSYFMTQGPAVKEKKKIKKKVKRLLEKYECLVEETIPELEFQIRELEWEIEMQQESCRNSENEEMRNQKKVAKELQEKNQLLLAYGIRSLKKDMMLKVDAKQHIFHIESFHFIDAFL